MHQAKASRSRCTPWLLEAAVIALNAAINAPAFAVTTAPIKPQVSYGTNEKKETVSQRISAMHSALRIAPTQEADWGKVADVMRRNDADMQKLAADRRLKAPVHLTAVEDLKTYEAFNQAHLEGLKDLITAFEVLYTSMPVLQQANADKVMARFGHAPAIFHRKHPVNSVT